MRSIHANKQRRLPAGQSLAEIVIALAIFIIIAASLGSLALHSFTLLERSREMILAQALASEALAAARSIRNRDFSELGYGRYALRQENGRFVLSGPGEADVIGKFTREIELAPVYRDSENMLTDPDAIGAWLDGNSRAVTARVNWITGQQKELTLENFTYLINLEEQAVWETAGE